MSVILNVVTVLLGPPRHVREKGLKKDIPGVVRTCLYAHGWGGSLY